MKINYLINGEEKKLPVCFANFIFKKNERKQGIRIQDKKLNTNQIITLKIFHTFFWCFCC